MNVCKNGIDFGETHVVDLLFQLGLGLGQSVDFVFLCLQVVQGLLMGLLEGLLLLGQLSKTFILRGHLLRQVLHLNNMNEWIISVLWLDNTDRIYNGEGIIIVLQLDKAARV